MGLILSDTLYLGTATPGSGGGGGGSSLPDQTGHSGEFLTTDGTDASWSDKPLVNTATGDKSLTIGGTAATQQYSTNVGIESKTPSATEGAATAVGAKAEATGWYSTAVGSEALATKRDTVALGCHAEATGAQATALGHYAHATAQRAIQIGYGTNNTPDTASFGVFYNGAWVNYEMMSADGTIPTARLTKVNTTITLAAADWSAGTQTVSVTGVTATGIVFVSPDPTDQSAYTSAGIICSAQAAGTLTFTCSTTPSADLSVNVVML